MRQASNTVGLFLALVTVSLFAASPGHRGAELAAVVKAERDFAARAQVVDARQAFAEHFAPDAIAYSPFPGPAFPKLAEPENWVVNIQWRPVAAAISGAGDMGYTTGPAEYRKTPAEAPYGFGFYTSVWERQADGKYKVAIDAGIRTTADAMKVADWTPPAQAPIGSGAVSTEAQAGAQRELVRLDKALGEAGGDALARALSSEARYHLSGEAPALGREAVLARLKSSGMTLRWVPQGGKIARSADFGFTYGKGSFNKPGATPAAGELAYLNVWQKQGDEWKLLVHVVTPVVPRPATQG